MVQSTYGSVLAILHGDMVTTKLLAWMVEGAAAWLCLSLEANEQQHLALGICHCS